MITQNCFVKSEGKIKTFSDHTHTHTHTKKRHLGVTDIYEKDKKKLTNITKLRGNLTLSKGDFRVQMKKIRIQLTSICCLSFHWVGPIFTETLLSCTRPYSISL